jgi:hypothetical protein
MGEDLMVMPALDPLEWAPGTTLQEVIRRAKAGDVKARAFLDELRGAEAEASAELAEKEDIWSILRPEEDDE